MTATERTVLGPCRCQQCDGVVVYTMRGHTRLGWLHEDGTFHCRVIPAGLSRREYGRLWMRQKRRAAA